ALHVFRKHIVMNFARVLVILLVCLGQLGAQENALTPMTSSDGSQGRANRTVQRARLGTVRLRHIGADSITCIAFSRKGDILASSSADNTHEGTVGQEPWRVYFWDTKTGKGINRFCGYEVGVHWVSFSPNGEILAVAGKAVTLWQ